MTDFTVDLQADMLRAALLCASTQETKYYLCGVSLEPSWDGARLVATDGHLMFLAAIKTGDAVFDKMILPSAALIKALKGYKPAYLTLTKAGATWTLGDVVFQPVDGTFPDWTRIVPRVLPSDPVPALFEPQYVVTMDKIASCLDGKGSEARIYSDGQSPAVVTFGARDDCLAVLMPKRRHGVERGHYDLQDVAAMLCQMTAPDAQDSAASK
ncbi:MAG: hypothetical protein JZU63_07995 [Rhodoferax sp.]|nr:hypothetical protein [Rhodoferax sp.]